MGDCSLTDFLIVIELGAKLRNQVWELLLGLVGLWVFGGFIFAPLFLLFLFFLHQYRALNVIDSFHTFEIVSIIATIRLNWAPHENFLWFINLCLNLLQGHYISALLRLRVTYRFAGRERLVKADQVLLVVTEGPALCCPLQTVDQRGQELLFGLEKRYQTRNHHYLDVWI